MSILVRYPLNGNANDASGVVNGTPTDITYKQGIENQAAIFNAATSKIDLPANAKLNLTNVFTISMILNKTANTANQLLLITKKYYQAGFNGNWLIRATSDTQIAFASWDGIGSLSYKEFTLPNFLNKYMHLIVSCDGSNLRVYADAKESSSGALAHTKALIDGGVSGMQIGIATPVASVNVPFSGLMDDIRFFNHNFSPAERKNLFMYYKGLF